MLTERAAVAAAHPTSLRVLGHVGDCRPCSLGIWREPLVLARCLGLHTMVWPNIMVTSPEGCPAALGGGHVPLPSPNWTVLQGRVTQICRGRPDVAFRLTWALFSHPQFPMGPGSDGPMGGMGGMEPHHMNGSLGECCLRAPRAPAASRPWGKSGREERGRREPGLRVRLQQGFFPFVPTPQGQET